MDTPLQIAICEDTPADAELLVSLIAGSGVAARREVFSSGRRYWRPLRRGNTI